jgi:hypothetical protein
MPQRRPIRRTLSIPTTGLLGAAVLGVGVLLACSHRAPEPVSAEPVAAVPSDIAFYTHVLYGGESAYLVDGKWYRPGVNGWVVFASEPIELEMIRQSLEEGHSLLGLL